MLIEKTLLSRDALNGIMSEFIFTEVGNDFDDSSMESKLGAVEKAIDQGELLILFSELQNKAYLIRKDQFTENVVEEPC